MNLDTEKTVRQLALEIPHATRIFEQLGIDYCCGGKLSLREACEHRKLALNDVIESLEHPAVIPQTEQSENWSEKPLNRLVKHIVSTHHVYVKHEVPRLNALLAKIAHKHGENHPELLQVETTFNSLGEELTSHLMKEEQVLFPHIAAFEHDLEAGKTPRRAMFGSVENPVRMMQMEHDSAGEALRVLRAATSDYNPPADACTSYRAAYAALKDFEADLHQHIHLENNILFPRAVELEQQALAV